MKRIKESLAAFWQHLKCLYPPTFHKLLKRVAQEAYQDGWSNGFDRGHMRGFMAMRNRLDKHRERYAYVKPSERN